MYFFLIFYLSSNDVTKMTIKLLIVISFQKKTFVFLCYKPLKDSLERFIGLMFLLFLLNVEPHYTITWQKFNYVNYTDIVVYLIFLGRLPTVLVQMIVVYRIWIDTP